jgi:hypothetical protein
MGDDAGEAFGPIVERNELFAGLVVDDERLIFHSKVFSPALPAATPRPREREPLIGIDAVEIMRWPATAIMAPGAGRRSSFENLGEERAACLS